MWLRVGSERGVHDDGGLRGRARVELAGAAGRERRQRRQQVVVHQRLALRARLPSHGRAGRRRDQELLGQRRRLQARERHGRHRLREVAVDARAVELEQVQLHARARRRQRAVVVHTQATETSQPLESGFVRECTK